MHQREEALEQNALQQLAFQLFVMVFAKEGPAVRTEAIQFVKVERLRSSLKLVLGYFFHEYLSSSTLPTGLPPADLSDKVCDCLACALHVVFGSLLHFSRV
jgi:hypothetical protein